METLGFCAALYTILVISSTVVGAIYLSETNASDDEAKRFFANLVFFPILLPIWIFKGARYAINININ